MGSSRFHRPRFSFSNATSRFWRRILSKRSLIFASICALYLFFALFGYSQQYQDKPADKDKYRHTRGLYTLDNARPDAVDSYTRAQNVPPTRNNVVYITLKSKRLKPANIRGTIRPKLRRKSKRTPLTQSPFTQNKLGTLGRNAGQNGRYVAQENFLGETLNVDYKSLNMVHDSHFDQQLDSRVSSIRIYSQRAPPWFSPEDVKAMRFLADAKAVRMKKIPHEDFSSLLIFESEAVGNHKLLEGSNLCGGQCGVIGNPVDNTEVFAFHLDRVLGLNRTLPAVSRKFSFLNGRSRNKSLSADCCCTMCELACGHWWSSSHTVQLKATWLHLFMLTTVRPKTRDSTFTTNNGRLLSYFSSLDGQLCPVVLWDASVHPEGNSVLKLTWGEYQNALKQRCLMPKSFSPKPDSICSTVHHHEWSKLALFDFLLQVIKRGLYLQYVIV